MHELQWIPRRVAELVRANGIDSRGSLAKSTGLSRGTIYAAFDQNWAGLATHSVIAQIAGVFNVPLAELVETRRKVPNSVRRGQA